jgi:hypothetical protein
MPVWLLMATTMSRLVNLAILIKNRSTLTKWAANLNKKTKLFGWINASATEENAFWSGFPPQRAAKAGR